MTQSKFKVAELEKELALKNRELEIEKAFEKVRAFAMTMRHSTDLQEVVNLVAKELDNMSLDITGVFMVINNNEIDKQFTFWGSTGVAENYMKRAAIPFLDRPIYRVLAEGTTKGERFFTEDYSREEKIEFFEHLFKYPPYNSSTPEWKEQVLSREGGYTRSVSVSHYTSIFVVNHFGRKLSVEENKILQRFGQVFEQSYTRFLDIQRAEALARESQIEAALERVRSRALGMHSTSEMQLVANEVSNQLRGLGLELDAVGMSGTIYLEEGYDVWLGGADATKTLRIPFNDDTQVQREYNEVLKKRPPFFAKTYSGEVKKEYIDKLLSHGEFPVELKNKMINATAFSTTLALTKNSGIQVVRYTPEPYTEKENEILQKFAKVFEQAYIRFMDLQKSEAQARESQIEAALERVRAKAMAMNNSSDLTETVRLLFQELNSLDLTPIRCGLGVFDKFLPEAEIWATTKGENGIVLNTGGKLLFKGHHVLEDIYESWKDQKEFHSVMQGDDLKNYGEVVRSQVPTPDWVKGLHRYDAIFPFPQGAIYVVDTKPSTDEELVIYRKFTSVMALTYQRYEDIKESEARAREAEIQLALERVRARTMAMHKSEELAETAAILFQQMTELGVTPERLNICLIKEADKVLEVWSTDQYGTKISHHFNASLDEPTTGKPVYKAWKEKKKSVVIDLSGKELNDWIKYVREVMGMTIKTELVREHRIHSVAFFSQGMLLTTTHEPLPEESMKLLERFADVFNLTYRRFLDLQKAEAQTREAIKQASVDRVRGEIASMRNSEDLNRITPIIWRELKTLEIPFIRCGVFIVDEENEKVQVYLTTPEGKSLAVLNLSFDANELTSDTVLYWKANRIYKKHWNKEEFISWTKSMIQIGQIQKAETYQGSSTPPETLDLHFIPFTQGMLYVGNVSPLTEEKLEVVKTLAEAFSIAYARYEDFKNIEKAKSKIEITLNELKIAEAKLKELDQLKSRFFANISHEFRTPLTLILGQIESVMSENIKVKEKGKLQIANRNARRLLTLINQLLDLSKLEAGSMELKAEQHNIVSFLKSLFYSFESLAESQKIILKFESKYENIPVLFDEDKMEKIFYNLISNALKFVSSDGEIKVLLNIINSNVEIRIKDNGIGIPSNRLPHIFDRFYQVDDSSTRKHEGTGIGLALTKELIELHKGKISVNSKAGEGSEFIITLPLGNDKIKKEEFVKLKPEEYLNVNNFSTPQKEEKINEPDSSASENQEIVLIVEDNFDVRNYICELLKTEYKVIEASDGEKGILNAKDEIPDIIITDLMMPNMDGYEFSKKIRAEENTSHIPIIMLTAKAGLDDKIEGLETGIDAYLTKPFSAKELKVRVRNLIYQRKQLRKKFSKLTIINPSEVSSISADQVFLEKTIKVIENNYTDENFVVENLADQMHMSISQLNRKFNALLDQPPGQLIRSLRLQKAADLLKQNAGTVTEICYKVGFNDHAYFSRAFKKQFNCAPSKFKNNKENKF